MTTTAVASLFRGLIPTAAESSSQAGTQDGLTRGAIFSRVLAAVGQLAGGDTAQSRGLTFTVPGDTATEAAAAGDLRTALADILAAAQARLKTLAEQPSGGSTEDVDKILRETADAVAGLLVGFDAATGANALAVVRAELGRIQAARGGAALGEMIGGLGTAETARGTAAKAAMADLALLAGRLGIALQGGEGGEGAQAVAGTQADAAGATVQTTLSFAQQAAGSGATMVPRATVGDAQAAASSDDADAVPLGLAAALPNASRSEQKGIVPELAAALDRISAPSAAAVPDIRPMIVAQTPVMTQVATLEPAATMPDLSNKVQAQIRGRSFEEGTTKIELSPRGLGDLEIELSPDEAGRLRVVIRAESPTVLAALRTDRDALMGLLRESGTQVANSGLSFEGFGTRQGSGRHQRGRADVATGTTTTTPSEADVQADPVRRPGSGRIDILT